MPRAWGKLLLPYVSSAVDTDALYSDDTDRLIVCANTIFPLGRRSPSVGPHGPTASALQLWGLSFRGFGLRGLGFRV